MKLEKDLWRELKRYKSKINWTRLENRALFGTPDLLGYAPSGHWFLVELKLTSANKINLSAHQISFHLRHPKNSFILAKQGTQGPCKMFPGTSILRLVACGFKLDEACCLSLEACGLHLESLGA